MKPIDLYQHSLPETDAALVARIQQAAEETPAREKGLAIHVRAIETLRAKGYTYRDIASWFSERGISVNHVDVWRAHKNNMEPEELIETADQDDEWRHYVDKQQTGNSIFYGEVEYDSEGNKITKAPSTETPVGQASPPEESEKKSLKTKRTRNK